MYFTPFHIGS